MSSKPGFRAVVPQEADGLMKKIVVNTIADLKKELPWIWTGFKQQEKESLKDILALHFVFKTARVALAWHDWLDVILERPYFKDHRVNIVTNEDALELDVTYYICASEEIRNIVAQALEESSRGEDPK